MKIGLVFLDWWQDGQSIRHTERYRELILEHGGPTFAATIELDEDDERDFRESLKEGFTPVFYVVADEEVRDSVKTCKSRDGWAERVGGW